MLFLIRCTVLLIHSCRVNIQDEENRGLEDNSSSGKAQSGDPEDPTPQSVSGPHRGGIIDFPLSRSHVSECAHC